MNKNGNTALADTAPIRKRVAALIKRLRRLYTWQQEAGEEITFVETLVATILSQNTTDVNSHRAYLQLRATYPDWNQVANAQPDDLAEAIRICGLADQKSRTISSALRTIRERYGNFDLEEFREIPEDELLDELTTIKGIGLKTASCTMMFALNRDLCAVDTHIHRVANRLGIVHASTPDKTFHQLRPLIPKGKARQLHVGLIHFGRDICKAQRPHCYECVLYDLCDWEQKEEYAEARRPGPRPASGDFLIIDGLRPGNMTRQQPKQAPPRQNSNKQYE